MIPETVLGYQLQPQLAVVQGRLLEVWRHAQVIDIRKAEGRDATAALSELPGIVAAVVREACVVMSEIVADCEANPPSSRVHGREEWDLQSLRNSYLPFEQVIDTTVESRLGSYAVVEEMAFVAQLELNQRLERLLRLKETHSPAVRLGECDGALRRTRKALAAVDRAVSKADGVEPLLDFESELVTSLRVRGAYVKLRQRLRPLEHDDNPVRVRLRLAGTLIAKVVGWDAYAQMRVGDRLMLRDLQTRILSWLGTEQSTAAGGEQLMADFAAFGELLSLVNRRQELVEHDCAALERAMEALEGGRVSEIPALVAPVRGRCRNVDELLDRTTESCADEWQQAIRTALREMGRRCQ